VGTSYSFTTIWKTTAPLSIVWPVIQDTLNWPSWWKDFTEVKLLHNGDDLGIGSKFRFTLRSPALYRLTFDLELVQREEFALLAVSATGELEGHGYWEFAREEGHTLLICKWNVATRKGWMNTLAFLLKPAFIYSHKQVMINGARSLQQYLGYSVTALH